MNNKTTLLDIFNNIQKPISNKIKNNKNNIKQIPFIQKYIISYLTHKNILIGILFFVLIWLIAKWFFENVYVNVSDKFKAKQKLRKEKFLNFIKSIFTFVYNSLTPFTLLIFLYISYMFKDKVSYVFKIIIDLFQFILSMINTNHIIKFLLISIVLIIICFIGKKLLETVNIIQTQKDTVSYLVNNRNNVLKDINNINNTIMDNNFNIKEHERFIKKNLLDWGNIKQSCEDDKKIANEKLGDIAIQIPTKFKNNVNIYNIKNKTANEMRELRNKQLEERQQLMQKRRERLQKLQTEIVYARMDAHEKTVTENKILTEQQRLLNKQKASKNALEHLKNQTLIARLRNGRVDPQAYLELTGEKNIF